MADQPNEGVLPPATFFNVLRVSASKREVYVDLGQKMGGANSVSHLVGRFVTTPGHVREIIRVLERTLASVDALPEVDSSAKQ